MTSSLNSPRRQAVNGAESSPSELRKAYLDFIRSNILTSSIHTTNHKPERYYVSERTLRRQVFDQEVVIRSINYGSLYRALFYAGLVSLHRWHNNTARL